ncbi:hypothetical protein KFK09_000681 [Dendrobium nobile]|uniref:Mvd1 C-terminal domain-containing protein n=1 Tax=Dendrobium nobile TaxID=94219 RepID=A0A8T3CEK7_DENNO|nr:hypothetical protein KFK09_000681 [Dendrobium nobile]
MEDENGLMIISYGSHVALYSGQSFHDKYLLNSSIHFRCRTKCCFDRTDRKVALVFFKDFCSYFPPGPDYELNRYGFSNINHSCRRGMNYPAHVLLGGMVILLYCEKDVNDIFADLEDHEADGGMADMPPVVFLSCKVSAGPIEGRILSCCLKNCRYARSFRPVLPTEGEWQQECLKKLKRKVLEGWFTKKNSKKKSWNSKRRAVLKKTEQPSCGWFAEEKEKSKKRAGTAFFWLADCRKLQERHLLCFLIYIKKGKAPFGLLKEEEEGEEERLVLEKPEFVAYTFDAGPNAVLIAPNRKVASSLLQRLLFYFPPGPDYELNSYVLGDKTILQEAGIESLNHIEALKPPPEAKDKVPSQRFAGDVSYFICTRSGKGPEILMEEEHALISSQTGLPKLVT